MQYPLSSLHSIQFHKRTTWLSHNGQEPAHCLCNDLAWALRLKIKIGV